MVSGNEIMECYTSLVTNSTPGKYTCTSNPKRINDISTNKLICNTANWASTRKNGTECKNGNFIYPNI